MTNVIPANVIVCPHCKTHFENTVVNGIALVDLVGRIASRKQMYCRLTLDSFERIKDQEHSAIDFMTAKKIVLDNLNDFNRDVQTFLGYGLEVE